MQGAILRWRLCAQVCAAGLLVVIVICGVLVHSRGVQQRAGADAVRDGRVAVQRASDELRWLQRDADRREPLALDVGALGVSITDAVSRLAEAGDVVDWRIVGMDEAASRQARAGRVRLVVDIVSAHGPAFLLQLGILQSAAGPRPVVIDGCSIDRRATDQGLAGLPALVARCALAWPWWVDT